MKAKNHYLSGLYEVFHSIGNPDPELGVMFCIMSMQIFFILDVSIIFQFRIPLTEELGNKWIVRLISGSILWLINKYIFGIRESVYSEYPPLSKRTTLLITILYFTATIGFLFYSSKNQ
ncbi:hypothetical protein [Emticicia sp. TH156]|uniref:hypothetical protein n=1 Tax=Emticicia sp. TH156 TaxID=2067454 RepID=UPI000C760FD5|nr:hypothetical protein [Emticicia sp. TH156]PLK42090.1 hypothetical protein C0V77_22740 [Emticicia sp. TH156]